MEVLFCQREWDKRAENLHFLQNAKITNSGWTLILVAKVCQSFLDERDVWLEFIWVLFLTENMEPKFSNLKI